VGMFFYVFSLSFASSSREDYTKSSSFGVLWGFAFKFSFFLRVLLTNLSLLKKKKKKAH
jgi:hypothetical protein